MITKGKRGEYLYNYQFKEIKVFRKKEKGPEFTNQMLNSRKGYSNNEGNHTKYSINANKAGKKSLYLIKGGKISSLDNSIITSTNKDERKRAELKKTFSH